MIDFSKLKAYMSPSKLERIFKCPASAKLQYMTKDRENAGSIKGSLYHKVMQDMIKGVSIEDTPDNEEAQILARDLVDFIKDYGGHVDIEKPVSLKPLFGSDRVGYIDVFLAQQGEVLIIEYKAGRSEVTLSRDNLQMLSYASIIRKELLDNGYKNTIINGMLVQPRLDVWDMCTYTNEMLDNFEAKVKELLVEVEQNPPRFNAKGFHCNYCGFLPMCPAKKEEVKDIVLTKSDTVRSLKRLSVEEMVRIASRAREIEFFIESVKNILKAKLLDGEEIEGVNLQFRNSAAKWVDEEKAREFLLKHLPENKVDKVNLITPTQAARLLSNLDVDIDHLITHNEKHVLLKCN